MTTISDIELRQKGMSILLDALGEVDAERFITLQNRDPFDYTQWQKGLFKNMGVNEISAGAMSLNKKK